MVKMKALGTFHATNIRADNVLEGDVFEVNATDAKLLEDRGLAKAYSGNTDPVNQAVVTDPNPVTAKITDAESNAATDLNAEAKALTISRNKMEAAPENKAAPATRARKAK